MISLKYKDGKLIGVNEDSAPRPCNITKMVKESGNYGFADSVRRYHPELVLKKNELPGPVKIPPKKEEPEDDL